MENVIGGRQQRDDFRGGLSAASWPLLLAALSACTSTHPDDGGISAQAPDLDTGVVTRDVYLAPAGADASGYGSFSRRVNATSGNGKRAQRTPVQSRFRKIRRTEKATTGRPEL